jgi:hypothetical protein
LPTVNNRCKADVGIKKYKSRKQRRVYMPKKTKATPRKEAEVLEQIAAWCLDKHPTVEVQKCEYEKLIEETGEKKIIDATMIGRYAKKSRSGAKGCLIAELEFEEHQQTKYSILQDMVKITIPLRKLHYWRNDIPQYWLKVDNDGTPFMVNYRYVYENKHNKENMRPYGHYTKPEQTIRIIVAERKDKTKRWQNSVIIGWDNIFKELHRVVKLARF